MIELTATEASRRFSELLDGVEHRHEQYVIVRRGRVIARLAPVAAATGADVKALLRRHSLDDAWGGEAAALREQLTAEERF